MLDDDPTLDAACYGLGIAQIKGGRLNEARKNLEPLLAKAPNEIVYNLALVDLDITGNRLDVAQQRVDRMLKLYPNNYPLRQMRSDLLIKQGKAKEAEKILDGLLKSRPQDPDVWYEVAEVRGLAGNTIGLHQARAEYFALVGDFEQAIEQLDFAKRRASSNFPLAARIDARQQELIEQQKMVKQMMR